MQRFFKLVSLIALLALTLSPVALAEDLTIISQVTPAKGEPTTSTQYITSDKMRISDGQNDTIVDLSSGNITMIDHKKKNYFETTFEEMRAHFVELEKMLDSNPMMARMLGNATTVDVQETSETRQIAGYGCTNYLLTIGKKFQQKVCITSEIDMPIEYYDARKMLYSMMGPMATRFEKMLEEMKKLNGFALATDIDTKVMGFDASSSSEATEVKLGSISADVFAVPQGYKKKKSPFEK